MGLEEVLAKLSTEKAIVAAFHLEGEFYEEVVEEEGSVTEGSMGMPLVNRALEEVLKRSTAVCIFVRSSFEAPTDHVMVMEDTCGNIVGHDVPACKMAEFKDDPSIIWLCDDFAIYPDRTEMHDIVMVMLPQRAKAIGEEEGAKDAVILYPATTTDIMLRMHFGIPLDDPKLASAIIAFDKL
ncbi:MAG: hypothetical protein LBB30_03295 [Candidatus Methanoplasma sp.]|jgi:hypothetical protein|nr:hypothetical protein [Candidatus Methanoplasma sp.]